MIRERRSAYAANVPARARCDRSLLERIALNKGGLRTSAGAGPASASPLVLPTFFGAGGALRITAQTDHAIRSRRKSILFRCDAGNPPRDTGVRVASEF